MNTNQTGSSEAMRGCRAVLPVLLAVVSLAAICSVAAGADPGDTEPNGLVDLRDLLAVRNAIGQTGAPGFIGADLDTNGVVDNADLLIWRQNFPSTGTVIAPYLTVYYPADGSLVGDRRPNIVIDYSPVGLQLDMSSLQVTVDGEDYSADAIVGYRSAVVPVDSTLADGPHYVEASIEDSQGNLATARSDFTVTSLALQPRVAPQVGPAYLESTFFPGVIWADDPPSQYLWDWDNDGTWDNGSLGSWDNSARPDPTDHIFYEEGMKTVRFGVYQEGIPLLTDMTIPVAVTQSYASVSPSNGSSPLTVFLHGIAADLADPIVLYEWDYDYSGSFSADYSSSTNPSTAHVYVFPGVYHPRFRATHDSGAIIEHEIARGELHVTGAGAPTAVASAAQGSSALTVNLSGVGSDDGSIDLYEWDFDNDGTWDYSSTTTGDVAHTYPTAGVKVAALRVTDNESNTSIDRVRVETYAPATLEVLDDTVAPFDGETVAIRTNVTIDATVWLYIKHQDGRIIRTLVDHEFRPAGTYDDLWDGRDDRYEICHQDAYYAVLEYSYPGRTDKVDLTDSTGGDHYFASRVTADPGIFSPLEDDFWEMGFEIPSASRASLYILPGGNNRTDTPFDGKAFGAGTYYYSWAGLNSEGEFAPPQAHLWSVNGWTLPDNAIVVQGGATLVSVGIEPNIYSPTDRPIGEATADFEFEIDQRAAAMIKIVRMDNGNTIRSYVTDYLDAGLYTIVWDGRTAEDDRVSPGYYSISLEVVDEYGNLSVKRSAVCRVSY